MKSIFLVNEFSFPYTDLKFPGQASDERILYVTREAPITLHLRLLVLIIATGVMAFSSVLLPIWFDEYGLTGLGFIMPVGLLASVIFGAIGWWWLSILWKKSIFILTNRRLTKFIYSTPWNRYNLSLMLENVVDTGAYARGYFQALFGIGTFTARSSAGNREEKYFFIENVERYEDLKNYVNKVLFVYNRQVEKLENFRPFIPFLKGEARKRYMEKYPEYWS